MGRVHLLCVVTLCTCFAREPPMVTVPSQGQLMGKEISLIRTQRILAYLGIPYAQPPLGMLRFAPPVVEPLPAWDGIRNATEYEPACLQTTKDFNKQDLPFLRIISDLVIEHDEDCLYLNVFVPYGHAPPEGYATIVWLHPGNFTTGSPTMWNPYTLVFRQRVIVVTVAYRLNIMGFFTTMDGESPGNYGLMDQQAAMAWVKKNIKLFRGDPNNISLMGYGTGGMSIGMHMINYQSRGLFSKAIIMSANFINANAVKYPQEDRSLLDDLARYYTCYRPTALLIECLRRINGRDLVAYTSHIDWKPVIDVGLSNSTQPFLYELPRTSFEREDFAKIPVLTGYTNMEEVLAIDSLDSQNMSGDNISEEFVPSELSKIISKDLPQLNENDTCIYNYDHIAESVLFFYGPSIPVTDANSARKLIADFSTERNFGSSTYLHSQFISRYQPTFVYRFDMKPSTPAATAEIPEWVSVPHLFDLLYVWGVPYWVTLPDQEWDIRDKRTSDIIMTFWTNFAKTSNPNEGNIYPIRWDQFTKDSPGLLIIDRTFNMSNPERLDYKALEFWIDYYPKVVAISTQCCNATENSANTHLYSNRIFVSLILTFILLACIFR